MHIRSIEKGFCTNSKIELVDDLLSKGIHSDGVFEDTFIDVYISDIRDYEKTSINLLYRLLWERNYIKLKGGNTSDIPNMRDEFDDVNRQCSLVISLSEAIGYIYKATPPILQKDIPGSIRSYDAIISLLKTFLMDTKSPEYVHYLDLFFTHIHFKPFETQWNMLDQQKRADMIYDMKRNTAPVLYIIHSNKPVVKMMKPMSEVALVYGIFVATKSSLIETVDAITDNGFHIDNIHIANGRVYVSVWHHSMTIDADLAEIIDNSYGNIIK